MSQAPDAGAPASAEGQGAGVPAHRAHVLARLEVEMRQARGCFEWGRAAEIEAQMRALSAGSSVRPSKETAHAGEPVRERREAPRRASPAAGRRRG